MRIVTRPDLDGIVCAALLCDVEQITSPVKWASPHDIQEGLVEIRSGDIIANLPYHPNCSMWFDHHYSNRIDKPFKGAYKLEPSAARVVYDYYRGKFSRDYADLVAETDKIDSAALSIDEVIHPENYPYVLLSMTIQTYCRDDAPYWYLLTVLFQINDIGTLLNHPVIRQRCAEVIAQNQAYEVHLKAHTKIKGNVAVTDFRHFDLKPRGNRFLVYSLFPQTVAHLNIGYHDEDPNQIMVGAGHNIFNRNCRVNIGKLLSKYGGGGHRSVGSCRFNINEADVGIARILDTLMKNED